jgi:hypothetical protein
MTSSSSVVGSDPIETMLSHSKDLFDIAADGAAAADEGKTFLAAASDAITDKVADLANDSLRKVAGCPAGTVIGTVLEKIDDKLPRKIAISPDKLPTEEASLLTQVNEALDFDGISVFAGSSEHSRERVIMAQNLVQFFREVVHVSARPAEALLEGTPTTIAADGIAAAIEMVPLKTQKQLGLDTLLTSLRETVSGDPKVLVSTVLQGAASVTGNAACLHPGVHDLVQRVAAASAGDSKPLAAWCLQGLKTLDELSNGDERELQGVLVDAFKRYKEKRESDRLKYANPPAGQVHGDVVVNSSSTDHSASQDVLVRPHLEALPLVPPLVPQQQQPAVTQKDKDTHKSDLPAAKPKKLDFSKVHDGVVEASKKQLEETSLFVERQADFETFTGKVTVTLATKTRAQELRELTNISIFFQKKGWPQERIDYELKGARAKIKHRDEKLEKTHVDLGIRLESQKDRVEQAFANVQKAEALHAKTGNDACEISKAQVNFVAEQESLIRLLAEAARAPVQEGQQAVAPIAQTSATERTQKKQQKRQQPEQAAAPVPTMNGDGVGQEEMQPGGDPKPVADKAKAPDVPPWPTEADIHEIESEIAAVEKDISRAQAEEHRARKRAKRYKHWLRKHAQKIFHTVAQARKPGTVVEEETILSQENGKNKAKLEEKKEALVKKLDETKKKVAEGPPLTAEQAGSGPVNKDQATIPTMEKMPDIQAKETSSSIPPLSSIGTAAASSTAYSPQRTSSLPTPNLFFDSRTGSMNMQTPLQPRGARLFNAESKISELFGRGAVFPGKFETHAGGKVTFKFDDLQGSTFNPQRLREFAREHASKRAPQQAAPQSLSAAAAAPAPSPTLSASDQAYINSLRGVDSHTPLFVQKVACFFFVKTQNALIGVHDLVCKKQFDHDEKVEVHLRRLKEIEKQLPRINGPIQGSPLWVLEHRPLVGPAREALQSNPHIASYRVEAAKKILEIYHREHELHERNEQQTEKYRVVVRNVQEIDRRGDIQPCRIFTPQFLEEIGPYFTTIARCDETRLEELREQESKIRKNCIDPDIRMLVGTLPARLQAHVSSHSLYAKGVLELTSGTYSLKPDSEAFTTLSRLYIHEFVDTIQNGILKEEFLRSENGRQFRENLWKAYSDLEEKERLVVAAQQEHSQLGFGWRAIDWMRGTPKVAERMKELKSSKENVVKLMKQLHLNIVAQELEKTLEDDPLVEAKKSLLALLKGEQVDEQRGFIGTVLLPALGRKPLYSSSQAEAEGLPDERRWLRIGVPQTLFFGACENPESLAAKLIAFQWR